MNKHRKPSIHTNFGSGYVYVLVTGEKTYTLGMTGNPNIKQIPTSTPDDALTNGNSGVWLVYYHHFTDTLSALGFKILLEKLSPASSNYLIDRSNPELKPIEL